MGRGRRPAKDKAKPAVPRKSPGDQAATVPDLEKRQAEALEREAEALKREAEAREQLQTRDRELVEERDQRKATAEILRVISNSPTEMRPVFQAIVDSAVKLCDAAFGGLIRWDGDLMTIGAISSQTRPEERGAFEEIYPLPVTPRSRLVGLAIREKRVVQIDDVQAEPDVLSAAQNRRLVQAQGYRTFLAVPLLRGDACFGAISLWRRVVAPFSEQHITLLQTFAEQAVIAIENVRLFTELQEKNKALTTAHAQVSESLEQQTATSEVLKVISRSAFDLQPVLDTLIENAVRLCGADRGFIHRQDGEFYPVAASYGHTPEWLEVVKRNPIRQDRTSATGRAVLERRVIHIPDILADPEYRWAENQTGEEQMHRTVLSVPMLREGAVVGVITIRRSYEPPFTAQHVHLVTTFAAQAVIAIENVRLFKELETRNRDLTEALEQQTATSEILRAISQSPTEVQPVFDAIVLSSAALCHAPGCHHHH